MNQSANGCILITGLTIMRRLRTRRDIIVDPKKHRHGFGTAIPLNMFARAPDLFCNTHGYVADELIARGTLCKPDEEKPLTDGVFCITGECVKV